MTTNSHFQASTIGGVHQLSMVEARYNTLEGVTNRPGTTDFVPGVRQTIDVYNSWYHEAAERDKELAPAIARAQSNLGPDYKPIKGSELYGVNASSVTPRAVPGSRGMVHAPMMRGDVVDLPDRRDSFGHNDKNRISRVRGAD